MFRIWLAIIGVYSQHEAKTLAEAQSICRKENVIAEIEHSSRPRRVLVSFNPGCEPDFPWYCHVNPNEIKALEEGPEHDRILRVMREEVAKLDRLVLNGDMTAGERLINIAFLFEAAQKC
jgi:hypothetical protein